jgi:hypothetical protein
MSTIAPLHDQVISMLAEMDKAKSADKFHPIYLNYLNLYRDEYPKAYRTLTREYLWRKEVA